ncbi:hypothetical protein [Cryobacterium sp. PH31-O1]|uniref:hypothetical protein n=1 Tax=Cryobacterium sp. PH31-O1 TaxID=3046306 RepID=UPI0024BA662A|nr:hypothetical protein [Cryobacterium sp. PH31-O1]MDJ0337047.1 hypothetical protein [Cryobacterium sp. PH31-O1]
MSGNRLTIADDQLVVEPRGLDRLWSFTRRIEIPLTQVSGAFFDPTVIDDPQGIRFPGLHLPRKVAGTFYTNGKRQFWNTVGLEKAIVVELDAAQRFDRLVLTVVNPLGQVDMINAARRSS